MKHKQKIIIVILIVSMAYSIFNITNQMILIEKIDILVHPYNHYEEPSKNISLIVTENFDQIKNDLKEISAENNVSFWFGFQDSESEGAYYYWNINEEKYLKKAIGFNRDINLETFNQLQEPITNNTNNLYHIELPTTQSTYKIYPFQQYTDTNFSMPIEVYSDSEDNINGFLMDLSNKGILYREETQFFAREYSLFQKFYIALYQHKIGPLIYALFFVTLFSYLYGDRRNLTIKLVNGYSKMQYCMEKIKELLIIQLVFFIGTFPIVYFFFYQFKMKFFLPIFLSYLQLAGLSILFSLIFIGVIIYSFTDINQKAYIQGLKPKVFTSYLITIIKVGISILIFILLVPMAEHTIWNITSYRTATKKAEKYSNVYRISTKENYFVTLYSKSEEILKALDEFDNLISTRLYDEDINNTFEAKYKIVNVNSNYLKKFPILDANKVPIDPNRKNVIYAKKHNLEDVENLKQFEGFLNIEEDMETVIIDDDTTLNIYFRNITQDNEGNDFFANDFILLLQNDNLDLLSINFIFDNEEEIEEVKKAIEGIVNTDFIVFNNVSEEAQKEFDGYLQRIFDNIIRLSNYIVITIILSLIYYQMKFDKVKKDFSIYWINGISKFGYFYKEYIYQIILMVFMAIIGKNLLYPLSSGYLIFVIIITFMLIDTLSLLIFRHQFYYNLQKNVKERIV